MCELLLEFVGVIWVWILNVVELILWVLNWFLADRIGSQEVQCAVANHVRG